MLDLGWCEGALCKGNREIAGLFFQEPSAIYSKRIEQADQARKFCRDCPVFEKCLSWGVEHYEDIPYGYMAGYSADDRRVAFNGGAKLPDWREQPYLGLLDHPPTFLNARWRKPSIHYDGRRMGNRTKVAVENRPSCPQGHSPQNVHLNGRYADGARRWVCLQCSPERRSFKENYVA
jgi:hypothetical protein